VASVEQRIRKLRTRRSRALERHADAVRTATEQLDATLSQVDAQLQQLETWRNDPVVFVRTGPGPTVEVFHSSEQPCGKVNPVMVEAGRFESVPVGEAVARGLRPCTACAIGIHTGAA
jgi:hypothetical protein